VTLQEVLRTLNDAGVLGLLVLIIVGAYKKWWVVGWLYFEKDAECRELKRMLYSQVGLTDRATRVAEKLASGDGGS